LAPRAQRIAGGNSNRDNSFLLSAARSSLLIARSVPRVRRVLADARRRSAEGAARRRRQPSIPRRMKKKRLDLGFQGTLNLRGALSLGDELAESAPCLGRLS
ncbi:MAG TPA: hypothetical protein VK446_13545, partial [Methylocystis sp.]|nr:hypothetical protein [Methylocystis sp.]